jgi:hypothetical protein
MRIRRVVPVLALIVAGACAGRARPDSSFRERNVMRITEIQEGRTLGLGNLYDLVERNHPEWLQTVRANALTNNTPTVWIDLQRMGAVGSLRTIQLAGITGVRYLSPPEARGELGFDNPGGAIVVSTR